MKNKKESKKPVTKKKASTSPPVSKKKKPISSPRKPKKTNKKDENSTNSTNSTNRDYPEIELNEELAVIEYANGASLADISSKLKKNRSTIWHWLKKPIVSDCLNREREKIFIHAKAKTPRIVDLVYNDLERKALGGDLTFRDGVQYLEKTGYLQTTQDKAEQNRRIAQLADQLLQELMTELDNEEG